MNMPTPIPLQLPQSRRLTMPSTLRRALLCCVATLAFSLLLWVMSAAWRTEAETQRNNAHASMQKTASLLTSARETETARRVRAKRFALVKAALESLPSHKPEQEQLSAPPHTVEPSLTPHPVPPPIKTPPERRFDGILWRDDHIVALWFDGIPTDPATEPAIHIGNGIPGAMVSGHRQPLSPGQSWPLHNGGSRP